MATYAKYLIETRARLEISVAAHCMPRRSAARSCAQGPFTLLGQGFPALVSAQSDATHSGIEALARELARRLVPVIFAGNADTSVATDGAVLPTIQASAELTPIVLVQRAYRLIATLAVERL